MSSVLSVLSWAESLFMLFALFALWRSKEHKKFRALLIYFALRAASEVFFIGILRVGPLFHISWKTVYNTYFFAYWSTCAVGTVLIFFVIQDLFRSAMEPLPGLKRLGSIAFRWVACVSLIAAFAQMFTPRVSGYGLVVRACDEMLRCESIFILCLLFFLMVTAGKLGLSYRSRLFSVCFGFGILAAGNLLTASFLMNSSHTMMSSGLSLIDSGANILSMVIWTGVFLMREPIRTTIHLPVTSSLARWNEIATALSINPATPRVAVPAPANDFFLQDVEKVVDRILSKNSLNIAS